MKNLEISPQFTDMSKSDISVAVKEVIRNAYENGEDTLHILAIGSKMQEMGEQIKKIGSKSFLSELQKYDGNNTVRYNVQLRQIESGVKYDYSATPEIARRREEANKILESVKILEDLAKMTKTRTEYTDEDGVQIVIMPSGKSSTTTIQCKIL